MALCSLSTGRMATPCARAAAVTSAPAITSTSLFASAMVLPLSIAASTASSASVPDEAQMTISTSGWVATAISPSVPVSEASAVTFAPNASACSRRRSPLDPAARPTTFSLSGCARTTSRVLCPIDPVDPRMARFFMIRAGSTKQDPAYFRSVGQVLLFARLETVSDKHVVHRSPEKQRVDAIQTTSVPGDDRGRVLHIDAALQQRLEQIADDADRRDREAEYHTRRQCHLRKPPVADDREAQHASNASPDR